MTGSLFSILFPSTCSLCGEEHREVSPTGVCEVCWRSLEPWPGPHCDACGLPLASGRMEDAVVALCASCRSGEYDFDRARSFGLYTDSLRTVILQLKFRRRERLGKRLGGLLAQVWKEIEEDPAGDRVLLVPVPLHIARQRERGFNQAQLLARGLSAALKKTRGGRVPQVDARSLRKIRATPPQTGLSVRGRHENVRGVFAVVHAERIRNRRVVLVDDVMTTGATLSACARALKAAGSRQVSALTLGRATPQFPDSPAGNGGAVVDDFGPGRR
jgi:ComF family protein